jgi:hypothetical protein
VDRDFNSHQQRITLLEEIIKLQQQQLQTQVQLAASMSAPTVTSTSRSNIQPEIFYGLPSEDVEEWFERFELIAQHNGWDDIKKRHVLPLYLGGTAILCFRSCGHQALTYIELKAKFLSSFASVNPAYFAQERLNSRHQGDNEPLEGYAFAIQGLCLKVDRNMPDTMRRDHFLRGLQAKIKERLIPMQPATFEEALRMARLYEHAYQVSHPGNKSLQHSVHLEDYNPTILGYKPKNPLFPPISSVQEKGRRSEQSAGMYLVSSTPEDPVQALAKQVSELAAVVKQLRDQVQLSTSHARPGPLSNQDLSKANSNRPSCSYCGKPGHKFDNCFKRQRLQQAPPGSGVQKNEAAKPSSTPSNIPHPLN